MHAAPSAEQHDAPEDPTVEQDADGHGHEAVTEMHVGHDADEVRHAEDAEDAEGQP
jgi:hypothetical protein